MWKCSVGFLIVPLELSPVWSYQEPFRRTEILSLRFENFINYNKMLNLVKWRPFHKINSKKPTRHCVEKEFFVVWHEIKRGIQIEDEEGENVVCEGKGEMLMLKQGAACVADAPAEWKAGLEKKWQSPILRTDRRSCWKFTLFVGHSTPPRSLFTWDCFGFKHRSFKRWAGFQPNPSVLVGLKITFHPDATCREFTSRLTKSFSLSKDETSTHCSNLRDLISLCRLQFRWWRLQAERNSAP